ncbi:ribonuclease P protein subunit p20-like [Anneissia japonica]|uniref:ribonuclease P protein subunit p20-like n=1 Tax=Anneissia japonica TaxID=1529436 RepID=UPI0014254FD3|nr:ribonuclease P protein subunit p20-like [Anneissia japonica]
MATSMEDQSSHINEKPMSKIDENESLLRKRLPQKLPKRKNDIYVNTKTNFNGQLQRCKKILDSGCDEVTIHGLGAAVNRAINLALRIQEMSHGFLELAVNTSTVDLVDDLDGDGEKTTQERNNSAVHIKIYRSSTAT